jgi:hypothetical protein
MPFPIAAAMVGGGLLASYIGSRQKGSMGYAPLPFDTGANRAVDNARIAAEFKSAAGREPNANEIEQYARYIKNGDLEYGDIGQILQGSPELSKQRLESYTDQYGQRLTAADNSFLDSAANRIGAQAQSQFAGLGRPNSSAMAAQVFGQGGQVAQSLAMQRQSALANFYGQNLQSNMGQYVDRADQTQGRAYKREDNRAAFNQALTGYQTQRSDYNTDLENQYRRNQKQGFNQLGGSLIGAGLGYANGGGMAGAQFGAGIGGKAGGLF